METLVKTENARAGIPVPAANNLRAIRTERGKTLHECAEAAGVTRQAIYKAERRSDALAISKWKLLAEFLKCPLHELT